MTLARASLAWIMLLVDRSASMEVIKTPTVEALNGFIKQHGTNLNTRLSVVQFGTSPHTGALEMTTMFDTAIPRSRSRAIEKLDYRPEGDTPLLAAVDSAITRMEQYVRPQDRALLVIQTDGYENASPKEITYTSVRARIEAKRKLGNWTFAYLGAELESWKTGEDFGIPPFHTLSWSPTDAGVKAVYQTTSDAVARWKSTRELKGPERFYPLQLPAPKP